MIALIAIVASTLVSLLFLAPWIWQFYDREIPLSETRPLTRAEWAQVKKEKKKMGRPRIGQGAKVVAVTLEKGFLEQVDAYAKKHEMKRAELITRGLRLAMGEP